MKYFLIIPIVFAVILAVFLQNDQKEVSSCVLCHEGIEHISPNHIELTCVGCHSGDNKSSDKALSHAGMLGKGNPSSPDVWLQTCNKCHEYQVKRVSNTLMMTNSGIIRNTLLAWGEDATTNYGTDNLTTYDKKGESINIKNVGGFDNIVADMYRKFCSGCHLGKSAYLGYTGVHSSGCATCHFSYGDYGDYIGKDKAMQGQYFYPKTHEMQSLPDDNVCLTCHSRSGRIALTYKGLYDGNNSLVPTKNGFPGPKMTSGDRNVRHFQADIHYKRGMECIDCHTSFEIMGDGYYYENMYMQLEVSCQSCHGSISELPKTIKIDREEFSALVESKNYKKQAKFGDEMVLTDKGRAYSNVFKINDEFVLFGKRNGVEHKVKTITDTKEHQIAGHKRLECFTCHSQNVIQCYGCHVKYDERETMYDYVNDTETKGLFTETEDLRTFYPFPLALNQRGMISPTTPGCQTFLTHIDENGTVIRNEFVFNFRGKKKLKFAPFFAHSVGEKAVTCADCHSTPFFYGFGEGLFSNDKMKFTSPTICDECEDPLTSLYYIDNNTFKNTSDIVRENSRVLNKGEIVNIINANKCIVCHDKNDSKYYEKEVNYEKTLNDSTHKPLLK